MRMCVMDFGGSWERHLSLVEFAYNNSYQAIIKMAPFEAKVIGPDSVLDALEKVTLIKERLVAAQDRQKAYANHQWCELEFAVGTIVLLKVSPMKANMRYGRKGKLNPRYIGPYQGSSSRLSC